MTRQEAGAKIAGFLFALPPPFQSEPVFPILPAVHQSRNLEDRCRPFAVSGHGVESQREASVRRMSRTGFRMEAIQTMAKFISWSLVVCLLVGMAGASAQEALTDKPKLVTKSLSPRELDRREAMKLYGLGLMCERDNRLLEAARHLEDAIKLDPQAMPIYKSAIPLYLALERIEDALSACRKTVELSPGEHDTWYLYGRLLKDQGKGKEASAALAKAIACPKLKEQPEFHVQIASELGQWREEAKDIDGALAAYGEVVKVLEHPLLLIESGLFTRKEIDAKAAEMYEHIGTLCLQAGRYERAIDAFTKTQKKDPELSTRVNYHLARVRLAQERPAEALKHLDEFLKSQPQTTEPYELKIALLQKLNRADEIIESLKSYADRDVHNIELQLLLAKQYAGQRQWVEAEERYKAIAREAPRPDVYRGLFQLYKAQGQTRIGDILEQLDKAIKSATSKAGPGSASAALNARAMLVVLRDDAELVKSLLKIAGRELNAGQPSARHHETWRFLAVLAARSKQLDAAEQLYRECMNHMTPANEFEVYVGYLRVLWQQNKLEEIVRVCRKGLKEANHSNRLKFYQDLAQALSQLDKIEEALAAADEAVKVADDENRLGFRLMRARYLSMADKMDRAVAECQELLKDAGSQKETRHIRYTLSGIYSTANKHAQAEEQLRLILEADPNDDSANNDLGYIMADQGKNLDEAERLIRKAIELDREQKRQATREKADEGSEEASETRDAKVSPDDDKDHAAFVDSLGWVLFRKGQVEAARQELEKAATLPDGAEDPVIWDHLGDVYLRLNKPDQARTAWQKAEKLYEVEKRRKRDEHYRELKQKLKLLR